MTIYVGNLALQTRSEDLEGLFTPYGQVDNVLIVLNPETGQSRGFGFVEMGDAVAQKAIDALDGTELQGSRIRVNQARDRGARPPRRSW